MSTTQIQQMLSHICYASPYYDQLSNKSSNRKLWGLQRHHQVQHCSVDSRQKTSNCKTHDVNVFHLYLCVW